MIDPADVMVLRPKPRPDIRVTRLKREHLPSNVAELANGVLWLNCDGLSMSVAAGQFVILDDENRACGVFGNYQFLNDYDRIA